VDASAPGDDANRRADAAVDSVDAAPPGTEFPISQFTDDASEDISGVVNTELANSSLFQRAERVGLRFTDLGIPQGTTISRARLQFTASSTVTQAMITIDLEADVMPSAFETSPGNIDARTRVPASQISWTQTPWAQDSIQTSPDLKDLVQTLVSSANWSTSSGLVFIMESTGASPVFSFEGALQDFPRRPRLLIDY
jgi:hypothetical protein